MRDATVNSAAEKSSPMNSKVFVANIGKVDPTYRSLKAIIWRIRKVAKEGSGTSWLCRGLESRAYLFYAGDSNGVMMGGHQLGRENFYFRKGRYVRGDGQEAT